MSVGAVVVVLIVALVAVVQSIAVSRSPNVDSTGTTHKAFDLRLLDCNPFEVGVLDGEAIIRSPPPPRAKENLDLEGDGVDIDGDGVDGSSTATCSLSIPSRPCSCCAKHCG